MCPAVLRDGTSSMHKRFVILLTVVLCGTATAAVGTRQALLRDGFALTGVEGRMSRPEANEPARSPYTGLEGDDLWFFETGSDVNDELTVVKAGARLELLPSATLGNMIADRGSLPGAGYMFWGRVTKYKGRNFVLPYYFMRVVEAPAAEPDKSEQPEERQEPNKPAESGRADGSGVAVQAEEPPVKDSNGVREERPEPKVKDANDMLGIPEDLLEEVKSREKIGPRKIVRPPTRAQAVVEDANAPERTAIEPRVAEKSATTRDSVLADRTAVLVGRADGRYVFVLDALGRNIEQVSLQLLPCEALELTEQRQAVVPEPIRFTIAGIRTGYKGRQYMLLQRAARIYGHGNFRPPLFLR